MLRSRATANFFGFILACWLAVAAGQETLEVISLRHRTAEQVIPVLRPLLAPGGALTGQYSQLIVRTTPDNLAQIRQVLASIDQPQRRLEILVRFDNVGDSASSGAQGSARISERGAAISGRIDSARSASDERVDQRLQVLEGGRATISSGGARPVRQREVLQTPGGPVIRDSTVMQDAASGFEVVPRVSGSNIAPRGAIRGQQASSTVSGRLGEWIELGGVDSASSRSDAGTFSSRSSAAGSSRRIWVKVEELR
jgi:hypothetical protein